MIHEFEPETALKAVGEILEADGAAAAVVGTQWRTGLPSGLEGRLTWRRFGGLYVGLAARRDLIFLKLYTAADDAGPGSKHFQDLIALGPTAELKEGADWVRSQDASKAFARLLNDVVDHARQRLFGPREPSD